MTLPKECRLMIDPPSSGAWNMAVDEALLEWATEQGGCCWRFYGWSEPTVSLGYFQQYADRRRHPLSQACPVVRRLTGGGAIVHDAELTYSLVLPAGHPLAARRDALYEMVHTSLIEVLAEFGVVATLHGESGHRPPADEPFLCFQRRTPGDVVVRQTKVAGSAQRRRRGAVLQHGSVLLRRSPAAKQLDALEDVAATPIAADALAEAWLARLSGRLALRWCRQSLCSQQRRRAEALAESRYTSKEWGGATTRT